MKNNVLLLAFFAFAFTANAQIKSNVTKNYYFGTKSQQQQKAPVKVQQKTTVIAPAPVASDTFPAPSFLILGGVGIPLSGYVFKAHPYRMEIGAHYVGHSGWHIGLEVQGPYGDCLPTYYGNKKTNFMTADVDLGWMKNYNSKFAGTGIDGFVGGAWSDGHQDGETPIHWGFSGTIGVRIAPGKEATLSAFVRGLLSVVSSTYYYNDSYYGKSVEYVDTPQGVVLVGAMLWFH